MVFVQEAVACISDAKLKKRIEVRNMVFFPTQSFILCCSSVADAGRWSLNENALIFFLRFAVNRCGSIRGLLHCMF